MPLLKFSEPREGGEANWMPVGHNGYVSNIYLHLLKRKAQRVPEIREMFSHEFLSDSEQTLR